ncbi:ABC-type multidrug transport system, ATPase component [Agrilactobacillus composti DSM 18527 = JCM 14202]|uniref:ABC-type multidrug transport system, ATPase component n=1 Tax=Agrilactobacillus composti DSM 18527 = JCM 14202 TaxID=1423734 RepID=X0QLR6_9LACO|nr:daunorubicin resistance protein DrrA family ABC transporter ATP-binding protein [Agrilactobacillus composti]KRM31070.1 ABC-type multidrug transport system, ATPase component [Agrilactobacillus composti DSM 18527 = JCM 14202]GAF39550.1 ABC transporter, ATP-binding protein [Agrilactobacillus composti DSM 18527 = JCM 14202]
MTIEYAIQIDNLTKRFGNFLAVNNVSLNVQKGEIFGLLGPNGAGKTTILRMLTTLLNPSSGTIQIFGHDVQKQSRQVRGLFGLTGQYAAVDEDISARENLMIFSRLNGLTKAQAKKRTTALLQEFSLLASADKAIADFSGGMRRRLDLAVSLISQPPLIFLDEPTTGLDPRTRTKMWTTIRQLVAQGSTIVLTTQYLEEADELADRIAVIDHGQLVQVGTPAALKATVGGVTLQTQLQNSALVSTAVAVISQTLQSTATASKNIITAKLTNPNQVTAVLNHLNDHHIPIANIAVKEPSMDDVFFALTSGKH